MAAGALEKGAVTGELLAGAEPAEVSDALRLLEARVDSLSLKDLEAAFECFLDDEQRRMHGVVYTPGFVVDYLVRNGLDLGWRKQATPPRICDPACGCGGFLLQAAGILHDVCGLTPERAFQECLFGFDTDPGALRHARCLAELYCASRGLSLPAGPGLFRTDTLLADPAELQRLCGLSGGFDLVATNPPYVKFQNLEPCYRTALQARFGKLARGNFSLAPLFLVAGYEILAPEGCLAVITQNNLYTSCAGEGVRRFLQENRCLRRIVDFGHQRVFREASAYTCLVFLGREPSSTFQYASLANGACEDSLRHARFATVRHDGLKPRKWRLAERRHVENLERIEKCGMPLGRMAAIRVGFATLKDSVFLVKEVNGYCKASPWPGGEFRIETGITRRAVKVPDLGGGEDGERTCRRVIFPYRKEDGKYRPIPEEEIRRQYPEAYGYLCACRTLLERRDRGGRSYPAWYAWGRTQGMEAPGPKLLTRTFSARPCFFPDESDRLFCNGYSVSPRLAPGPWGPSSLMVLERILNSRVMHYYAKLTSFQIGGDYQCYQKNFIERFGIPVLSERGAEEMLDLSGDDLDACLLDIYGLAAADLREIPQ